jgi:hypothetical protein
MPATAQDEPPHWRQFTTWRDELRANPGPMLTQWEAKADARLAWLHAYVAADRPAAEFDRWLANDAMATLDLLHTAMRLRPATDWTRIFAETLHVVQRCKDTGRFDAAAEFLDGLLQWLPADRMEQFTFQLELGECQRRAYRWHLAARALDAAAARARTDEDRVLLHVQRAALLLARGLPDLAVPEVEAAERASTDAWQRAQALFVRLRLEHSMQRPERAFARLLEFLAAPVPPEIADDPAWRARLAQLRIRAAIAVLADPDAVDPHETEAAGWLRAAIEEPATALDERILARTAWITHRLDRGMLTGIEAELAAATDEIARGPAATLDERRLAVATLSLRRARLAGAAAPVLRQCAGELERRWHELVGRWNEQPISRVGEGPLFFGDCRRAFVELLRAKLAGGSVAAIESAFDEIMRASATGSLARQLAAPPPSLAELRQRLTREGSGLLVFVPGHETSLVLAVDAESVTAHALPIGALAIDAARRDLLRAMEVARQGDGADALGAAAKRCADRLLPPEVASRVIGWSRIAIAGSESLGYLPFELLPGPDGSRLGTTHAVSYLPSVPVATWLAANRPAKTASPHDRVRVMACPDADVPPTAADRPAPLPFKDSDLDGVRASCPAEQLQVLHGAQASREAAFDPAVLLLQIIAHGVRDESRADPQGVLLGDGKIIWPTDIETLQSPRYVFLNVCRAGRGRLRRGDDGRHLVSGALLLAGARGVVLPVVDVGYRATLAFAADVHDALWRERTDLAEALRRARVAAQARGDGGELDAFLFHLVGLGDEQLAAPRSALGHEITPIRWPAVLIGGGAGAALLFAGWLVVRRRRRRAS